MEDKVFNLLEKMYAKLSSQINGLDNKIVDLDGKMNDKPGGKQGDCPPKETHAPVQGALS